MHNTEELLRSCLKGNSYSQKQLYKLYFNYAMTISMQYSNNRGEAEEILNDAFFVIFTKLDTYDFEKSFKPWLKRIIINKAID